MTKDLSTRFHLNMLDLKSIVKVLFYLVISVVVYVLAEYLTGAELSPTWIGVINLVLVALKKFLSDNGEIINEKK